MKKAILLLAYGAPNSLEDVEPYYTDIRGGRKPTPELLNQLIERYKLIGGKSPLLEITIAQAKAVEERFKGEYKVYIGMRHWAPWIKDTLLQMKNDGIDEAIAIVLAPHYSSMSVAKYFKIVDENLEALGNPFKVSKIERWGNHPLFIQALAQRVKDQLDKFTETERNDLMVLFTAHSLPARIIAENDPYYDQLLETSKLVAKAAGIKQWEFAFQSAGRTPEPWLGPDILEKLKDLSSRGKRAALVCIVGFLCDHLEVIYDIDIEAKPLAKSLDIHLERIEMLNASPLLIDVLEDLLRSA